MSIVRVIKRIYGPQNDIRAAIMDGMCAVTGFVILNFMSTEVINYFGARDLRSMTNSVGHYHLEISNTGLLPVAVTGVLGFALSLLASVAASHANRPEPKHRPISRTILAVAVVFILSALGGMAFAWSADLGSALQGLLTFLPVTVPAALRLTTKQAFTYRATSQPAAANNTAA